MIHIVPLPLFPSRAAMLSNSKITRVLVVFVFGIIFGFILFQYNRDSLKPTKYIYALVRKSIPTSFSDSNSSSNVSTRTNSTNQIKNLLKNQTKITKSLVQKIKSTVIKSLKFNPSTAKTNKPAKYETKSKPVTKPKGEPDLVVPKIMHYAWYHPTKLRFRFHHFISMLSAYKLIKPRKIMFWHERVPQGDWWTKIKQRIPIIEMVYRKGPTQVFGRKIHVPEHISDIVRLEAVMNYGGIYTDLDVIILKSFDPLLKYNTTMGYETGNGLCNGIIISRPHAKFLNIWHQAYKTFNDQQWAYHSVLLPAELAKKHPKLIHTEADTLHRPNWMETKWLYNNGTIWDWSKNYAIHLWYRFHKIDHNPEDIKKLNTTMGQMFRYIYYGKKDLIL